MIWILPVMAASPDDDALRKKLSSHMGTDVPEKFFCVRRPSLAEPFTPDVAALGVKMKNQGCRLKMVAVGDALIPPEKALLPAVGAEAWTSLDDDGKKGAVLNYTRFVLLAFDQPDGPETASIEGKGKSLTVSHPFWQRVPEPMTASHTDGVWSFDADGAVTAAQREGGKNVKAQFLMEDAGTKGVSAAIVTKALEARGKAIQRCFISAWREDLSLRAKTRLSWDVSGGKATNLKARGDGSNALLQCYANGLAQIEFPAEAKGSVDWLFIIYPTEE